MKFLIIWICAIAFLCGSIEGSVLRHEGSRKGQVVESVTNAESDEDAENKIAEYFDASNEELQPNNEPNLGGTRTTTENVEHFEPTPETTTQYKYKELLEPYVNRHRSTTRRPVDPEQLLAEIMKKYPTTTRPHLALSTRILVPTPEPTPETTTEYKYKDLVEAYTIAQPKYVPMKHVAGTHYVKVERGQDEHERVIEDYNRLFNHGSHPAPNDYSAPPKY